MGHCAAVLLCAGKRTLDSDTGHLLRRSAADETQQSICSIQHHQPNCDGNYDIIAWFLVFVSWILSGAGVFGNFFLYHFLLEN